MFHKPNTQGSFAEARGSHWHAIVHLCAQSRRSEIEQQGCYPADYFRVRRIQVMPSEWRAAPANCWRGSSTITTTDHASEPAVKGKGMGYTELQEFELPHQVWCTHLCFQNERNGAMPVPVATRIMGSLRFAGRQKSFARFAGAAATGRLVNGGLGTTAVCKNVMWRAGLR